MRTRNQVNVLTPWECEVISYQEFDGIRMPTEAKVSWCPFDGPQPYWPAKIEGLKFSFSETN